jgi:quercetin dioxygenase-like cupin family protein
MSPGAPIPESCCLPTPKRCFWVAGVQISHLSGPRNSDEVPDIIEHFVPPRAGPPFYLHRHRTEAFYVLQGRFRFRCGANEALLAAGQFLLFPKGLPHLYENVGEDWGRLLSVITPGGMEPFYVELDQASQKCPISFEQVHEISSRHGIAILTSHSGCSPLHVECPPAETPLQKNH